MKRTKAALNKWWWLLPVLWWTLPACNETEEACLDIYAQNFSIDADRACQFCCAYPSFRLNFSHKYRQGDTLLNLQYDEVVYNDDYGNPFRIEGLSFFLSEFQLLDGAGNAFSIRENLEVRVAAGNADSATLTVADDFIRADAGDFQQKTVGSIAWSGQFATLRFRVGLDSRLQGAGQDQFAASHPLAAADLYDAEAQSFLVQRISLWRDTSAIDSIPLTVGVDQLLVDEVLELPVDLAVAPGEGINLTLSVDYSRWFRGLNVAADPEDVLIAGFVEHFAEAFSVLSISVN